MTTRSKSIGTLAAIYDRYRQRAHFGDKGTIHSYIDVYEELLAPNRWSAVRVLEIGIASGLSLRMWEEYFDLSEVWGIDINDGPLEQILAEGGHNIEILDATKQEQVESRFHDMIFDVIIEDASHALDDQVAIYLNFRSHLARGGIYIIEDVGSREGLRDALKFAQPGIRLRLIDLYCKKKRFDDALAVIRAP